MKLHTFHAAHPVRQVSYLALLGITLPGLGLVAGCDSKPPVSPTINEPPGEDIVIDTGRTSPPATDAKAKPKP